MVSLFGLSYGQRGSSAVCRWQRGDQINERADQTSTGVGRGLAVRQASRKELIRGWRDGTDRKPQAIVTNFAVRAKSFLHGPTLRDVGYLRSPCVSNRVNMRYSLL